MGRIKLRWRIAGVLIAVSVSLLHSVPKCLQLWREYMHDVVTCLEASVPVSDDRS